VIYWSKIAASNLPHLYLAPCWGDPYLNFTLIFSVKNLESLGYRTALFVCAVS